MNNDFMNKANFLQHFQLYPLVNNTLAMTQHDNNRQAGVLLPIIVHHQLSVLFTVRALHLKHHPGQICFPGGKLEANDKSIITTALRETHEEIGLAAKHINILGQLNTQQTLTGFTIFPVVGLIEQAHANYQADANEVAEIFSVPLDYLLNQNNYQTINTIYQGKPHRVIFIQYKQYNIWGATAAILHTLCQHFQYSKVMNNNLTM